MDAAPRKIRINVSDMTIGFWQDDARDPSFRRDVFDGLTRHLGQRGWSVGPDLEVRRRHRCIAKNYRTCRKGAFVATLSVAGRSITLGVWAETWTKENQNGHRYDDGKRARLSYLDRLRFELELRHVLSWAQSRFDVEVKDHEAGRLGVHRGGLTAMEWIAAQYADSWHVRARPGWPESDAYDRTSLDRARLTHGAGVYLRDHSGRWIVGRAYANSNMWWVVLGPWRVENRSAHELRLQPPADLRQKGDENRRRRRLEGELRRAIGADDFARAALLKRILFGDSPIYRIFAHEKHGAFYGPNFSGYTRDHAAAGRYTGAEAEAEVLRAPHLLTLVCPDGRRIRGEDLLSATAPRELVHG